MSIIQDDSFFATIEVAGQWTGIAGHGEVQTPCGARRVENVRVGDMVVTRDHALQTVRMIWTHKITAADMRADADRTPVHFDTRAIGPMMPKRPVMLAPDTRVLVPSYLLCDVTGAGGLLRAGDIAGSSDAAWCDRDVEDVTFYNLVFERPEVVMVNGLAVETFHVCAQTAEYVPDFHQMDLRRRFPTLRGKGAKIPPLVYPPVRGEDYLPGFG